MTTPSFEIRQTWLNALLPQVEREGWTPLAARRAAEEAGLTQGDQALAAPNGVVDLIDHFFYQAAEQMQTAMATRDSSAERTHERVASALRLWLDQLEPNKAAVRRAAGHGLLPWGAGAATRRVWSIADAVWDAAGDTATDYNRQTKRALLSAVIPSIVVYWLAHDDQAKVDRHIERRLQQAMRFGQVGSKLARPVLDLLERRQKRRD